MIHLCGRYDLRVLETREYVACRDLAARVCLRVLASRLSHVSLLSYVLSVIDVYSHVHSVVIHAFLLRVSAPLDY